MRSLFHAVAAAGLFAASLLPVSDARAGDAARGAYFAAISDCGGCHTPGAMTPEPDMSRMLGGNDIGFEIPGLGVFYPPNLTNDMATGLGTWTDDEIARAIRTGVRPDGRMLAPIMPYHAYAAYSDSDVADLVAYLRSLPVVEHKVPGPFGPEEVPPAPYLAFVMPAQ